MESTSKEKYIEAIGRRKTAFARVRITPASKQTITVNDRELTKFFTVRELVNVVTSPFEIVKPEQKFKITALVKGGGIASQAESVRLGISRALLEVDRTFRAKLKLEGYLKRDPRAKERRKFGLKKARKAPQWSKR
ncbi:MAG: ribosomal protein small subunit ribosomal protein [Candidatus Parcubacteria bacterium]|jgi:small subunit ribosomal protein S9